MKTGNKPFTAEDAEFYKIRWSLGVMSPRVPSMEISKRMKHDPMMYPALPNLNRIPDFRSKYWSYSKPQERSSVGYELLWRTLADQAHLGTSALIVSSLAEILYCEVYFLEIYSLILPRLIQ